MAHPPIKNLNQPILWILFLALMLRLWGITYGFPLFLVNDEPALVLGALKMMELKTLIPALHQDEFKKVLYYPPLPSYFYLVTLAPVIALKYALSGFPPLADFKDAIALDPTFIWVAARVLNALIGVGAVFVTYLLTKKATGSERASLLAALFLSLSFYHLQLSQVVRHWMPAALLIYLAWLKAADLKTSDSKKLYFLSGLFTGLGGGVNTSSAIAVLPGLIAHFSRKGQSLGKKIISLRLGLFLLTALAVALLFVALYPYGLTRGEGAGTVGGDFSMRLGFILNRSLSGWSAFILDYLKLLVRYETILLAASLIGAAALFRKNRTFVTTVFLFSVFYLTLLYLFFNAIPRALVFILPAMAVMAGYGADRLMLKAQSHLRPAWRNAFALYGAAFLIFFAYPLVVDLRYNLVLNRKDTRLVAKEWIEKNIPPGAKILADLQYLRLINTKEGISDLEKLDPSGLRSSDRALLRRDGKTYPSPAFYVLNLHFISPSKPERLTASPDYFKKLGFKYVIVEYEYADRSDLYPPTRRLVESLERVARFQPYFSDGFRRSLDISGEIATINPLGLFKLERFGQAVDVYKL